MGDVQGVPLAGMAHSAYRKHCQHLHIKPMAWDAMSEKMRECWIQVVYSVVEWIELMAKQSAPLCPACGGRRYILHPTGMIECPSCRTGG
jgi:hypothetical protein